jgi:hypothetical protein
MPAPNTTDTFSLKPSAIRAYIITNRQIHHIHILSEQGQNALRKHLTQNFIAYEILFLYECDSEIQCKEKYGPPPQCDGGPGMGMPERSIPSGPFQSCQDR